METSRSYLDTLPRAWEKMAKPRQVAWLGGQKTCVMWLEFTGVRTPSAELATSVHVTGKVSGCSA